MSNTLTISAFAENIYRAKDTVARELVGFIPSVMVNSANDGVSINGTVTSLVTAQPTLNTSITPAMTIPDGDDQTISALTMQIAQTANVRIPIVGEVWQKLNNTAGSQKALDDLFAQALRKIVNTIEAHVGSVAYKASSRATGTAGTTPFGTNFNIIADVRKILVDNGCPEDGDLSIVMNTAAGTKLRQLSNLYKANEAGTDGVLRRAELLNLFGFSLKESAGVASHTAGAGSGQLINNASNEAIGETTLTFDTMTVNTTGIKAGDVITHASDSTNKYVVGTGSTATSGDIVINNPGLLVAAANNDAITIGGSYTANLAFHRSAIELVVRPPIMPPGGDAATDVMTLQDTMSGLVFQIALYGGYKMKMIDITTYYQAKAWKSEFIATMLG